MRLRVIAWAFAASLVPALAVAAEPTAQDLKRARELFASAQEDERNGAWREALSKLEEIAKVKMTPGVRFHRATCKEQLGLLTQALDDYARAESEARVEQNTEVLRAVKKPLEALGARVPKLRVVWPESVERPRILVDGALLEVPSGEPFPINPGEHAIIASAEGRELESTQVVTKENETATVRLTMGPKREVPPMVVTGPVTVRPLVAPSRTLPMVLTIASGTLVLGGVGAYLLAGGAQSDLRACAETDCDQRSGLRAQVRTWDTVALGAWIGAGVLGTAAIVLWTTSSSTTYARVGPGMVAIGKSWH